MSRIEITHQLQFRGSHRLTAPEHRREEIGEVCDVVHGHEYFLMATFLVADSEVIDPQFSRVTIPKVLKIEIRDPLHNKDLNSVLKNTSGESIAKWCFEQIRRSQVGDQLLKVELQETRKNSFFYPELV